MSAGGEDGPRNWLKGTCQTPGDYLAIEVNGHQADQAAMSLGLLVDETGVICEGTITNVGFWPTYFRDPMRERVRVAPARSCEVE